MDNLPPEELLVHTLALLEHRLRRIEYVLNGGESSNKRFSGDNALTRLDRLQSQLGQLAARNRTVEQLLRLQSRHPDLFKADKDVDTGEESEQDQKLSLIFSEAPLYSSTASQLRQLSDLPLPPTSSFTHLISQTPRFAAIQARQAQQAGDIAELRKRSAVLVGRWYEVHVLGVGRAWAKSEQALRDIERAIGRLERSMDVI